VFPHAEAKFFLIATEEERARRRVAELPAGTDLDQVLRDIRERDQRDASRDVAPMKPADDAVLVDSSAQTIEQVVDSLAAVVSLRTG
jgi:CMP/dCMP kinase